MVEERNGHKQERRKAWYKLTKIGRRIKRRRRGIEIKDVITRHSRETFTPHNKPERMTITTNEKEENGSRVFS